MPTGESAGSAIDVLGAGRGVDSDGGGLEGVGLRSKEPWAAVKLRADVDELR